jgi:parallel beta-helix repeat protein
VVKQYSFGIEFSYCNNSIVHDNSIDENSIGIYLEGSKGSGNLVYHNNFIDNAQNVNVEQQSGYNTTDAINVRGVVSWDNHGIGNYWSDYDGQGTYIIDENNIDHHPLVQPVDISGTPPIIFITVVLSIVVVVFTSLIYYFKKRKH